MTLAAMVARHIQLLFLLAAAQSVAATITASQVKAATAAASNVASQACVRGPILCPPAIEATALTAMIVLAAECSAGQQDLVPVLRSVRRVRRVVLVRPEQRYRPGLHRLTHRHNRCLSGRQYPVRGIWLRLAVPVCYPRWRA
jgi:hypothetical protein